MIIENIHDLLLLPGMSKTMACDDRKYSIHRLLFLLGLSKTTVYDYRKYTTLLLPGIFNTTACDCIKYFFFFLIFFCDHLGLYYIFLHCIQYVALYCCVVAAAAAPLFLGGF